MNIILTGEPQSTNNLYRSHCRFGHPAVYMTDKGKSLKESYGYQAKSQWRWGVSDKPFEVSIYLYFKTQRKHDIDNYGKILLDSMTGIVWKDDSQIWKMTVNKMVDKKNPRIEISIDEALS